MFISYSITIVLLSYIPSYTRILKQSSSGILSLSLRFYCYYLTCLNCTGKDSNCLLTLIIPLYIPPLLYRNYLRYWKKYRCFLFLFSANFPRRCAGNSCRLFSYYLNKMVHGIDKDWYTPTISIIPLKYAYNPSRLFNSHLMYQRYLVRLCWDSSS